MQLVIEKPTAVFDLSRIQPGYLFYGKHKTWHEGKAGIVTSVTEKQLTVQYFPGLANITNHFFIPAEEIVAGEWDVRWSLDMSEVYCLPKDAEENGQDNLAPPDGGLEIGNSSGEGDMGNESGGIDL